jgi:hypothetical protein
MNQCHASDTSEWSSIAMVCMISVLTGVREEDNRRHKVHAVVRLTALVTLYFHPLYIIIIEILSSIHVSSALIILYISYSIPTTNSGSTYHLF